MIPTALVWLRQELRLRDNPALVCAARSAKSIVPVYIWAPEEEGDWPPGAASRWWLHRSLQALDRDLRARGLRLVVRRGPVMSALRGLACETGASSVHFCRRYEPAARAQELDVALGLEAAGIETFAHAGALLVEPWELTNKSGGPYRVYSAFRRAALQRLRPPPPLAVPRMAPPRTWPKSQPIASLQLLPARAWFDGLDAEWIPGETGARLRLRRFLGSRLVRYGEQRDRPDLEGTSRLSPHLHFGEIGPRQLWHALGMRRTSAFLDELLWREFAYHLLHHFPRSPLEPLREEFAHFPWRREPRLMRAWQRGETGFAMVDAGMRQLWRSGWMHNRVRMICASVLVKNLRVPWQEGARWFWDTLVDADLASNTLNWQWVAGCGTDAAPFFRIFNPERQAQRFDPEARYRRAWLGSDYRVSPIVDLDASREAALEAWHALRAKRRTPQASLPIRD